MAAKIAFRPDIEGLRAVAVLGVIAYHADPAWGQGGFAGVDVFFVISGFLICNLIWREISTTGKFDVLGFWARRFRRLLPMAVTVVLASLVAATFLHSPFRLEKDAEDSLYALAYATNWWEYAENTDYFATEEKPGLFVHYWSLAVEEQFYLAASALAVLLAVAVGSAGRARVALSVIGFLALVSLIVCIVTSDQVQPLAFFGSHARAWEFAAGALAVPLARANVEGHPAWKSAACGAGLLLVLCSFAFINDKMAYPGAWAMLPVAGAVLLVAYGGNAGPSWRNPVALLLSARPMRYLGRISYSLYLWHWCVFIFAKELIADDIVAIGLATLITFYLAAVSHVAIEEPLRHGAWLSASRWRSLMASLVVTGLAGAAASAALHYSSLARQNAIVDGRTISLDKKKGFPRIYAGEPSCHVSQKRVEYEPCLFGDVNGSRTIVLFGDSHAAHWFPALEVIARSGGFRLYSRTKSACGPAEIITYNGAFKRTYDECVAWRKNVLEEIARLRPDLVVVGSTTEYRPVQSDGTAYPEGQAQQVRESAVNSTVARLAAAARHVVVMQDTPRFSQEPVECASEGKSQRDCGVSLAAAVKNPFPWWKPSLDWPQNVRLVSMNDVLCEEGFCLPFDRDGLRFHDVHHLHADYAARLAPLLKSRLRVSQQ
jgi:peptidoglycan/LPS O-acetylase OafA/YrhL